MNLANRLIVSVVSLLFGAAGVYLILLASGTVGSRDLQDEHFITQIWRVEFSTGADFWVLVGIALGLLAVGVALLILQFASLGRRRDGRMALLRDDENGYVHISVQSIRELTERTALGVRSVMNAKCSVKVTPGGLRMKCDLTLRMASDLPAVTADVQTVVYEVVERLTGLKVIDVSVAARYGRHRDEPLLAR